MRVIYTKMLVYCFNCYFVLDKLDMESGTDLDAAILLTIREFQAFSE